ncbi:MAG TPA: DegT/DnrJ/EryC1/StrS family aminotransferase [Acidimicrobiia bacterium]
MKIPFMDLGRLHESIRPEIDAAINTVIEGSSFIGGDHLKRFEGAFADAHGLPAAAGCASGTDALALALRALGIGPGDEVVVPGMTFVATAEAVVHAGAAPVLADVDPVTLLLTPETVEPVLTERTRAVIPVHLYGHVVPFDHIRAWKERGLLVIEDAAQAHLATWNGEFVGTYGDAACFSFYPGKNLGAFGDGGIVVSREVSVVDEVRRIRDHGRHSKYTHDVVGWCSRLDGLQAAILDVKLRHLPEWTESRRAHADRYRRALGDHLVPWEEGAVHHLLVARAPDPDGVASRLADAGIGTGRHYPVALSQQPWLAGPSLPASEKAADDVISLPMDPLMTPEEVDRVAEAFLEAVS